MQQICNTIIRDVPVYVDPDKFDSLLGRIGVKSLTNDALKFLVVYIIGRWWTKFRGVTTYETIGIVGMVAYVTYRVMALPELTVNYNCTLPDNAFFSQYATNNFHR